MKMLYRIFVPSLVAALLNSVPAKTQPLRGQLEVDTPEEALALEKFFATHVENETMPLNLWEFNQLYRIKGAPMYGKAWLVFDINEGGGVENLKIWQRNRELEFGPRMKKLFEERLKFSEGHPREKVFFEVGFCGYYLCNLHFQRLSGPMEPAITSYMFPYISETQMRKRQCADIVIRFDVNKKGLAVRTKILSSTNPGPYETYLKLLFSWFEFEKNKPAQGIEMLFKVEALGFCD